MWDSVKANKFPLFLYTVTNLLYENAYLEINTVKYNGSLSVIRFQFTEKFYNKLRISCKFVFATKLWSEFI